MIKRDFNAGLEESSALKKHDERRSLKDSNSSPPQQKKVLNLPSNIPEKQDLQNCNDLTELDLSNQHLSLSEIGSLIQTTRISYLLKVKMSGCGLTQIPLCLRHCIRLQELELSNNFLGDSDTSLLTNSTFVCKLIKLDLSGCGFKENPVKNLHFGRLEELNLSNNPLDKSFSSLCLFGSTMLKKLSLSSCGLRHLPSDLLSLNELEELDLSNNPLGNSSSDTSLLDLVPTIWLKKLNLSDCGLKKWPFVRHEPINLQELNLSNNMIDHQDQLKRSERKMSRLSTFQTISELSEQRLIGLGLFKAAKIVFEDVVYLQLDGG